MPPYSHRSVAVALASALYTVPSPRTFITTARLPRKRPRRQGQDREQSYTGFPDSSVIGKIPVWPDIFWRSSGRHLGPTCSQPTRSPERGAGPHVHLQSEIRCGGSCLRRSRDHEGHSKMRRWLGQVGRQTSGPGTRFGASRSACCARVTTGHATAPPTAAMNLRLLIRSPRRRGRAIAAAPAASTSARFPR